MSFPQRIINYAANQVEKYGASYQLFGGFFLMNYFLPYFMWSHTAAEHYDFLFMLRLIGGILCTLLVLSEAWATKLQSYLPIFWYLTMLYCLPFMSSLMFLLTQGSMEWIINISITLILLFILVDWLTAIILTVVGILLGTGFYLAWAGPIHLPLDFSSKYLLVYQLIFGLLIGLFFARRKEQSFNVLLLQNQQLSQSQQAARKELASTLKYREQALKDLAPDDIALFDELTTSYIQQVIFRIADHMELDVTKIKLEALVKSIIALDSNKSHVTYKKYTHAEELEGDLTRITQMLLNAIEYLQEHTTSDQPITLAIEDATLGHPVAHMPGYTRTVAGIKITLTTMASLPATKPVYPIDLSNVDRPIIGQALDTLIVENIQLVDAHYGCIDEQSEHTQVYVLPINLREVRGKVMEIIRYPVSIDPEEVNHPLSISLEKELMEKLRTTQVDPSLIQKALNTIKRYHAGVKRRSGEPFFTHPIQVALILLDYSKDQEAVLGALLHDTVEDTSLSLHDVERMFGKTVKFLVAKATNLEDHKKRISLSDKENIVRILNYEDPRAALIKLSDRLHNMRTIQHHRLERRIYIAQETLDEFVPLARRLNLPAMADELEKLSRAALSK